MTPLPTHMPQRVPDPCHHDLRPGTTVCLHCRRAARDARIAHRNRILGQVAVVAVVIGVVAAGARAGLAAYRQGALPAVPQLMAATTKALVESLPGSTPAPAPAVAQQPDSATPRPDSALGMSAAVPVIPVGAPAAPAVSESGPMAPAAVPPAPVSAALPATPAPPLVMDGRTELEGGMFAIRAGDTVTVYFDTPEARTRRPDKFEQIVRATLPAIHGSTADSILGALAPGALLGSADLVNDLPTRGVHLRSSDGRALTLWPETRAGRDGPLVVSYRSVLRR